MSEGASMGENNIYMFISGKSLKIFKNHRARQFGIYVKTSRHSAEQSFVKIW
jgi:hypothetical protein